MKKVFVFFIMMWIVMSVTYCVKYENPSENFSSKIIPPSSENPDSLFTNPLWDGADPWIIKHDNFYYYCYSAGDGISISKSKYLTKKGDVKKVWTAPTNRWNSANIWAPELHYFNNKWYIYYAAGSKAGSPYIYQKAGVLEAKTDNPLGDYTDKGMLITSDTPKDTTSAVWAIDLTVFEFNKQLYAVWSGWEKPATTDNTVQHLYIAPMGNPYTISGKRVKISSPTTSWETGGPLNLNEGPEALIHGTDLFIIYSCRESWLKEYRLGQLRLKSFTNNPLDPNNWIKKGPVFEGTQDVYGVGHSSYTKSPDGKEDWIIYHSKKSTDPGWNRDVRMQKFKWNTDGSPDFGIPVKAGVPIRRPSGE